MNYMAIFSSFSSDKLQGYILFNRKSYFYDLLIEDVGCICLLDGWNITGFDKIQIQLN